jgi:hypothetical protein
MTAGQPRSRALREHGHSGEQEWGLMNDVSKGVFGTALLHVFLASLHIFSQIVLASCTLFEEKG